MLSLIVTFVSLIHCIATDGGIINAANDLDRVDVPAVGNSLPVLNEISALCQLQYYMKCTERDVLLSFGICATQNDNQDIFVAKCPYFELSGYNVTEPGYIRLPDNISELNDYMCGPLNRKGFLCKDCIDGFGPSVTSLGYKCSNCTDAWYGIPLYLAVELIPITLFYLIILIFKVRLTSAPMVLYIFYSQLVSYEILFFKDGSMERLLLDNKGSSLLTCILLFYSIWDLDFFRYILPPFCVSNNLQLIHIQFLRYISIVYPVLLVILTWICVELHDRNFKVLVWLWRPFHKCFVRLQRGWDAKSDIIDVFTAFFFLSYNKSLYQLILICHCPHLFSVVDENIYSRLILLFDVDTDCLSKKHLSFLIPVAIIFFIFNILPALVLVLYPFRWCRMCLLKCKAGRPSITAFVERFHACYRDGLDGGKDMRSFSGLYFFLVLLISMHNLLAIKIFKVSRLLYVTFIFLASTVLIAFIKPYKQTYMNALDTLLLAHLTVVCALLSREYYAEEGTQIFAIVLIPAAVFKLIILFIIVNKFKNKMVQWCKKVYKDMCDSKFASKVKDLVTDPVETQPLINPTSSTVEIT